MNCLNTEKWRKIDDFFFTYLYKDKKLLIQTYPFKVYSLGKAYLKNSLTQIIKELKKEKPSAISPGRYYLPLFIGTTNCNFRCKYCYAYNGSYGAILLNMRKSVIGKTINFITKKMEKLAKENTKKEIELAAVFFGGESLLNFEGVKYLTKKIKEAACYLSKNGQTKFKPLVIINTNGSLFYGKILEFIKENKENLELVISFDGLHHDKYRLSAQEKPTSDRVIEGIQKIKKIGVKFAIGCCEPPDEIENVDANIKYITNLFGKDTEINLAFIRGPIPSVKIKARYPGILESQYTNNSLKIFGEKVASLIRKGYVIFSRRFFNRIKEGGYLWRCPAALYEFCVFPNGDIYPCHNFISDDFKLGNVFEKNLNLLKKRQILKKFIKRSVNKISCKNCVFQTVCLSSFDCPSHSYYDLGNFERVDQRTCIAAKIIMEALFEKFLDEQGA